MATPIPLRGDHITLGQALKVSGIATTGGQAKIIVREGQIKVNGAVEQRPGRKLHAGDVVTDERGQEWIIQA